MKTLQQIRKATQKGATMVEYALLVALIAAAVAGTVLLLGDKIDDKFNEVITKMDEASGDTGDNTGGDNTGGDTSTQ